MFERVTIVGRVLLFLVSMTERSKRTQCEALSSVFVNEAIVQLISAANKNEIMIYNQ
jgi:hypothetical protein